jgi:hypothetical protein
LAPTRSHLHPVLRTCGRAGCRGGIELRGYIPRRLCDHVDFNDVVHDHHVEHHHHINYTQQADDLE